MRVHCLLVLPNSPAQHVSVVKETNFHSRWPDLRPCLITLGLPSVIFAVQLNEALYSF